MTDLVTWPTVLPVALVELPRQVAAILDASSRPVGLVTELAVLPELDPIIAGRTAATVLLIGDGWIGTEGPDVASAMVGGGAVALARSIAVRRHATGRVNVVCVPERLIGFAGSQHGPLTLEIRSVDVAEVVAFALGSQSSYIDGQVLYADGGRQLFSSLTA
jgi:NAD(P)-dependent dehydrogenase (short-subunit alcohol dehydrogenase family)